LRHLCKSQTADVIKDIQPLTFLHSKSQWTPEGGKR